MIILGYPGIGKTTTAKKEPRYIDLESSNFTNDYGIRGEDWWVYYCKTGIDLSRQGYVVFMSTHNEVRGYFEKNTNGQWVIMVYPTKDLKEPWIERLRNRYIKTGELKDLRAWTNTAQNFEGNLDAIAGSSLARYEIISMDFDLREFVENSIMWVGE